MTRPSGRAPDQLRAVSIERQFTRHAEGSVLVAFGDTRVLCTASIEERGPAWKKDGGWLTAEYGMLPRSTHTRSKREAAQGKQNGRTQEIQRLIGRSLRSVLDLDALVGLTITIDCDVLQADGGTRTASITGGYVALVDAIAASAQDPARSSAIRCTARLPRCRSASINGMPVLDLDYPEDSGCETDMNVVMNDGGGFIEVQGTAEGHAFRREELDAMLALAHKGVAELCIDRSGRRSPASEAEHARWPTSSSPAATARSCSNSKRCSGRTATGCGWCRSSATSSPRKAAPTFIENALIKARHAATVSRPYRRSPTTRVWKWRPSVAHRA